MARKPLVIQSTTSIDPKDQGRWNDFDQITAFIPTIETPEINADEEDINKVISGIPSPWARMLIFRYAIDSSDQSKKQDKKALRGIMTFYDQVITEWKALLALMALSTDKIKVKKVPLEGSFSPKEVTRYNPYELKSGLGAMLFEEKDLWSDLLDHPKGATGHIPFLQTIHYKINSENLVLIGATSPYSLVFTPPVIKLSSNESIRFYDTGRKKWMDPCSRKLTEEEVQKIYDFLLYIEDQLGAFEDAINLKRQNKPETLQRTGGLTQVIRNFRNELLAYSGKHAFALRLNNLFSNSLGFSAPFSLLFNAEAKLYLNLDNGRFHKRQSKDDGLQKVALEEFLAPSSTAVEVVFAKDESYESYARNAAYLLETEGRYFALPLSEKGILQFEKNLGNLLKGRRSKEDFHLLSASLKDGELKVKLRVKFFTDNPDDENEVDFAETVRSYKCELAGRLAKQKIIVWPDFVSESWQNYYYYSDLPHNDQNSEVTAHPLLGNHQLELLTNDDSKVPKLYRNIVTSVEAIKDSPQPQAVLSVKNPEKSTSTIHYEIFEANRPFVGTELWYGQNNPQVAGYLIACAAEQVEDRELLLRTFDEQGSKSAKVTVGIDFGSNNTAVSYFTHESDQILKLVGFKNRRRVFLGSDRISGRHDSEARLSELFFIHKEEPLGQVKSMMITHNENRLFRPDIDRKSAVLGGIPVFEPNLPIKGIPSKNKDTNYEIYMGNGTALVKYNMKWAIDSRENDYKFAYLKTLWLQINAEIFDLGYQPGILKWAIPSAMSRTIATNYNTLWGDVVRYCAPIKGTEVQIEDYISETVAVAKYAITADTHNLPGGGINVGEGTLGIGFDVGGSTTDILLVVKPGGNREEVLAMQSSVLIAAHAISDAAKKSKKIQQTLKKFVEKKGHKLHLTGISNINEETASYYLNAIFDRLEERDLEELYRDFYTGNCQEIFAITSYVTGVLLFYVGQLAARVIEVQDIQIDRFAIGLYGKGGNIFNWIPTVMRQDGVAYYQECFFAGLGVESKKEELKKQLNNTQEKEEKERIEAAIQRLSVKFSISDTTNFKTNPKHNKSEVAYGLSSPTKLALSSSEKAIPEILGEEGYQFGDTTLSSIDETKAAYLLKLNQTFAPPKEFKKLNEFISIYGRFVRQYKLIDVDVITKGTENLARDHFINYVKGLPQYLEAQKQGETTFDFKAPMFILEAMCLLDKIILPECFEKNN